ncbi:MAG TPA: SprT family zinc-dependent metalloprotease [Cellvibrionaceae bacterium]
MNASEPLPFAVDYRFSKRRTISIEVRESAVIVRAPKGVGQSLLTRFVNSRRHWVLQKLAAQQQKLAARPCYRFVAGEQLPYLSQQLMLEVVAAPKNTVVLNGDRLTAGVSGRSQQPVAIQVAALVSDWYKARALEVLSAKTHALCAQLGLNCTDIKVRATRSKWGHCTSEGRIQYNWQIVLAPEQVVDYLVAHEVCHLRHPHHGPAFWQMVEQVCPDYQHWRQWLREQGFRLVLS